METVTRKFLIKEMPDLTGLEKTIYNRFYLYNENGVIIRVQSIDDKYELERKVDKTELIRNEQKIEITKEEFESLSKLTTKTIQRDSYLIAGATPVTLRIYHGKYEGLVRGEVAFESLEEAQKFKPLDWFDKEITSSPLAKDGTLLNLSSEESKSLIKHD